MNPALLVLATHAPAAAWGGAPLDSAIHAVLGVSRGPAVAPGPELAARGDVGTGAGDGTRWPGHWERFAREVGRTGAGIDVRGLVAELAVLLRAIATASPSAAAPEILALAPATAGDLSALPAHRDVTSFASPRGGALLVRDPSSGMTAVVTHSPVGPGAPWAVELFADVPMPPQASSLSHAGAALTDAVHDAAELIAAGSAPYIGRGAGSGGADVPDPEPLELPAALSSAAHGLLDRADTVEHIRAAAHRAEAERGAPAEQQPALWGLQSAVNQVRRAVVARFAGEQLERRTGAEREPIAEVRGGGIRGAGGSRRRVSE